MFAARSHDQPVMPLYSNVIVMSDGMIGPPPGGNMQRRPLAPEGETGMAQQENPKDWIGATVSDLIKRAGELGIRPSELLRSADLGPLHQLMR